MFLDEYNAENPHPTAGAINLASLVIVVNGFTEKHLLTLGDAGLTRKFLTSLLRTAGRLNVRVGEIVNRLTC